MYDLSDLVFAFTLGTLVATYVITSVICYHQYKNKQNPVMDARTYLAGQAAMGYLAGNIYTGQVASLHSVRVADLIIKELHDNPGKPKT